MVVRYFEDGAFANDVPRKEVFRLIQTRLTSAEFQAIIEQLNQQIDDGRIHTSSWMPGADWTGTPLEPLYETAARSNQELAGGMYGLMVFFAFMQRPEVWMTGKFEKNGEPIGGRTYFRPG